MRVALTVIASLLLGACASPYYVHDPLSGYIGRDQVPPLLKSVRCELVTFYEANRQRALLFQAQANSKEGTAEDNWRLAVENYSYFDLDENQYSTLILDLKIIDTIGIPAGGSQTTLDNKRVLSPEATKIFHLGPSLGDQNTYAFTWNFLIKQDAKLTSESDEFNCYSKIESNRSRMASGETPEQAQFTRIMVNASEPLAAWLLRNAKTMGSGYFANSDELAKQQIVPAQTLYSFAIQTSVGLDSRLSITGARWNPAAIDVAGSIQQTSTLSFYINGSKAPTANSAKSGGAFIKAKIPPATHVIVDNPSQSKPSFVPDGAPAEPKKGEGKKAQPKPQPAGRRLPSYLQDKGHGYMLFPLTVTPPLPPP